MLLCVVVCVCVCVSLLLVVVGVWVGCCGAVDCYVLCVVLSEFEPAGLVTFGPIEVEQLEGVDDR